MANHRVIIKVRDFVEEEPVLIGKTEARLLLDRILREGAPDAQHEIDVVFEGVTGFSSSAARVIFYGLVDRFGQQVFDHLIFTGVDDSLLEVMESAVNDAIDPTRSTKLSA